MKKAYLLITMLFVTAGNMLAMNNNNNNHNNSYHLAALTQSFETYSQDSDNVVNTQTNHYLADDSDEEETTFKTHLDFKEAIEKRINKGEPYSARCLLAQWVEKFLKEQKIADLNTHISAINTMFENIKNAQKDHPKSAKAWKLLGTQIYRLNALVNTTQNNNNQQ